MPRSDTLFTPETGRRTVTGRWTHEPSAALNRYVEQVISRAPALTPAQRERITAALADAEAGR